MMLKDSKIRLEKDEINFMNTSKIIDWLDEATSVPEAPPVEEISRISYDVKLVAWLDILGIREVIKDDKTHDAESIISIMSELASYVKSACDTYVAEKKLNYLQIADGFMIVADLRLANELCAIIADIQWKILINLRMLSRGAITAGNVSIANEGSLIIGPAYVDAYVLESENAIFPRVIIPEVFFETTKDTLDFNFICTDSDHVKYIDFIAYIIDSTGIDSKRMNNILIQQGIYKMIQSQWNNAKSKHKFSLQQKYGWIKELFRKNKISEP